MKILALEPFHGGSHKAFLDGWSQASEHDWTVLGLPGYKWKWRMRHAAVHFAAETRQLLSRGREWDVIFCSDMLNLAEFLGLADERLGALPRVAYFHENQLTYPVRVDEERDYHFGMINLSTALAATRVWFNTAWHRDSFLRGARDFLQRMPDYRPMEIVKQIQARSSVQPQGVAAMPRRGKRKPGPLRIVWAARWEHDKNPADFFEAVGRLRDSGEEFRVSVVGEQFREVDPVFAEAQRELGDRIEHWGYLESRAEYEAVLGGADVIVSTANHEFFGVSVVEAVAAGAFPLVPKRLAYPEILGGEESDRYFYNGTVADLTGRLEELAGRLAASGSVWGEGDAGTAAGLVEKFTWPVLAPRLDKALKAAAKAR